MNTKDSKALEKLDKMGFRKNEKQSREKAQSPSNHNPHSSGFIRMVKKQKP